MSHSHKILNIASADIPLRDKFSQELGVSAVLAQLLLNRGIDSVKGAGEFLNPRLEDLSDPYDFKQMPQAVERVRQAARNKEKVLVHGDYDVDGITGLALVKASLESLGIAASHHLPHRVKEGYGLNKEIIKKALEQRVGLLITVDCGINNRQEIKELKRNHIDVIVTDHHEPLGEAVSDAAAVINPKVKACGYKFRELAGVAVAYRFCQALTGKDLFEELDLVCLGTIADVVPLTGENRIIAKEGLKAIQHSTRPGLKALIEVSRIKGRSIDSTFVSFILGPRLNASGRMDSAEISLNLLISKDAEAALELARAIEAQNRQRQKVEGRILQEAQEIINRDINFKEHRIIVISKEDWHPGVLGIVASKISDRFYRPTIVISMTEGLCKGSGRSIKNFHLFDALKQCEHLLEDFGGHAHAAGLVISRSSIDEFKKSINALAKERIRLEDLLPRLDIDMEIALGRLNEGIVAELQKLEPFGAGNPEPLFYSRNLKLRGQPQILARNTIKFWATDGGAVFQAIGFGMSALEESFRQSESFDMVYTPRMDNWQGESSLILEAKDLFFR